MKCIVNSSELLQGLSSTKNLAAARSSGMPILRCVKLQTEGDNSLALSTTDLEVSLSAKVPAVVKQQGGITIGADRLFQFIRRLPKEEPVGIETTPNAYMKLHAGLTAVSLAGADAEEYPALPGEHPGPGEVNFAKPEIQMELYPSLLLDMLKRVLYAATQDKTRYNLHSIFIEKDEGTDLLRFVATDGHRLGMVEQETGEDTGPLHDKVMLPYTAAHELAKLCFAKPSHSVEFGFSESHGIFRKGPIEMRTHLVQGEFPERWRETMKIAGEPIHLWVESSTLMDAIGRVALVSHDRSRAVKLSVSPEGIELHSTNPDVGEACEKLPTGYDGEAFSIGFNANYLLDGLRALDSKEVLITFSGEALPNHPVQMTTGDDSKAIAVVMPMRL